MAADKKVLHQVRLRLAYLMAWLRARRVAVPDRADSSAIKEYVKNARRAAQVCAGAFSAVHVYRSLYESKWLDSVEAQLALLHESMTEQCAAFDRSSTFAESLASIKEVRAWRASEERAREQLASIAVL